jgi:hypothetical protein
MPSTETKLNDDMLRTFLKTLTKDQLKSYGVVRDHSSDTEKSLEQPDCNHSENNKSPDGGKEDDA